MKKISRDFTAIIEVGDDIDVEEVEMVATIEASYIPSGVSFVEPTVIAGEPYVVEPEPPRAPKPICPKCSKEIEHLTAYWPATVIGTARFVNGELSVEFTDDNQLNDIVEEDKQAYHCPECDEELFKAGDEDRVIWFLENVATNT